MLEIFTALQVGLLCLFLVPSALSHYVLHFHLNLKFSGVIPFCCGFCQAYVLLKAAARLPINVFILLDTSWLALSNLPTRAVQAQAVWQQTDH